MSSPPPPVVWIETDLGTHIYLQGPAGHVPFDGTQPLGQPGFVLVDTPFRVANNDGTGRWAMTAPETTPILSGSPPFARMPQRVGIQTTGARTLTIPVQGYATNEANLARLIGVLQETINGSLPGGEGARLVIEYGDATTRMLILAGVAQETPGFWGDERKAGLVRITLTLQVTVGRGEGMDLLIINDHINGNARPLRNVSHAWAQSHGGPVRLTLSGGEMAQPGPKTIFAATVGADPGSGGALSTALVTTSSSGVDATPLTESAFGARRVRGLAVVENPSANLQLRLVIRLRDGAGSILYVGDWRTPGTATTIVDLGGVTLRRELTTLSGVELRMFVQYRSSNGTATSGTLRRIRILRPWTFARVSLTTASNETIVLQNITNDNLPGADQAYALAGTGAPREIGQVRGALPRGWRSGFLWLAWTHNGVYTTGATLTSAGQVWPVFETVASPDYLL